MTPRFEKGEATLRPALKMIGACIAASCTLPLCFLLLFFVPFAGGAGALILVIGVVSLLAYLAINTAVLGWLLVTRTLRALRSAGRPAPVSPRPLAATRLHTAALQTRQRGFRA